MLPVDMWLDASKVDIGLVVGGFLKLLSSVLKVKVSSAAISRLNPLIMRVSLAVKIYSTVATAATKKLQASKGCSDELQGTLQPTKSHCARPASGLIIDSSAPTVWVTKFHFVILKRKEPVCSTRLLGVNETTKSV